MSGRRLSRLNPLRRRRRRRLVHRELTVGEAKE